MRKANFCVRRVRELALLLMGVFMAVEIGPAPLAHSAQPLAFEPQALKSKHALLPSMMVLGKFFQDLDDVYKMTDPKEPSYLKLIEKLPNGGLGRMLRYRGWVNQEREWVDLEFIYEDREARLTILDYESGKFFKATFTKKKEVFFYPLSSNDIKGFRKEGSGSPVSSSKFLAAKKAGLYADDASKQAFHKNPEIVSANQKSNKPWMRAPPKEEVTFNE